MNTRKMFPGSIILLFFCLLAGPALADDQRLLILGDSLSAAYGVPTEKAWVALLRERLDQQGYTGWQVVNASISGETTDGGVRRLPDLLEKHSPAVVVIELGGNDGLRGFPPRVTRDALATMIRRSRESDARVLLVGMQMPPNLGKRYTEAFRAIYPDLAKEYDTALVPFFLKGIYNQQAMMQSDGIHPTASAQPTLLDNVWPHLEPLLAQASSERNATARRSDQ
ncbi:acyl-CoA thioesterase-1 [Tamilnaduibacter salinus]|uniref:Acyl-CoA thioesterase-1 n=1 Tax=Tamilnaduibacter salinus TaxID=1484056 RepID=A0A2U1D025_9GAMM|nr:arylesterase [Tamilnaduibacter salinus]PVY78390.1 acyl-CoA thioesterase-1 [Tamilnaduibacter salinus]